MAFVTVNVDKAYIADPVTLIPRAFVTKIDQVSLDFDGSRDLAYGGNGTLPILSVPKDQKPAVNIQGIEFWAQAIASITGGTSTKATTEAPIVQPWIDQRTISPSGQLNVPLSYPISATSTSVSIITDLDFKTFTTVATSPTTGQFVTPTSGTQQLTFNASDAGKVINIAYNFDNTTGGQIGYGATSTPQMQHFVSTGYWVNTADPSRTPFAASLVVAQCQFTDKFTFTQERNKVTSNKIALTIFDPGGAQSAAQLIPTQPFM